MVLDPLLAIVDLLLNATQKLSLISVRYVVQAVQVDQLSVAELGLRRPIGNYFLHLLLHLFKLGHLDQDFMHFFVREAFEELRAVGLVELLLGHAVLVQILQVLDPVLLVLEVSDHGVIDAVGAFRPGILQQSLRIEVHL